MSTDNKPITGWVAWHPDPAWHSTIIQTACYDEDDFDVFRKLMQLFDAYDFNTSMPGVSESMLRATSVTEFIKAAQANGWRHRQVELRFTDKGHDDE